MHLTAISRSLSKRRVGLTQQIRRVMKLTAILLTVACLQVAAKGHAQKVTLNLKDAPIQKVFREISRQTGLSIVCSESLFEGFKPITIYAKDEDVRSVMEQCLRGQSLEFKLDGNAIVIKRIQSADNSITAEPPPAIDVHGKVVNENGGPVAGASVQVKGDKTKGTSTDANGEFTLKAVDENATLIISGVAIETFEVRVKGRAELGTLPAKIKITTGEEVIINKGYYTTTQRLNTGNVSVVKGEDIQKQPVSDPLMALEGRVPGLYISQTSGVPGAAMNLISLRGKNSIANGNNPLFIVDGVPFTSTSLSNLSAIGPAQMSPFNTIDPSDIESITVLKDADATAIYGSRGANGVILITTKKGKAGKTKVDFNVFSGAGKIDHTIPLLNTQQYLEMRHEAFANDSKTPGTTDYDINGSWDTTRYTDWEKVMIGGTAHYSKAEGNISGGNENTQFVFGGGYSKQTTVYPGDYNDQIGSAHFNLTHTSTNRRFHAIFSASYTNDNNTLPTGDFTPITYLPPDAPALYDANGNLNWQQNSSGVYTFPNPLAQTNASLTNVTDNLTGNANLSYEILPGLQLSANGGYNKIEMNQNYITPLTAYSPALANNTNLRSHRYANNTLKTWLIEPQLNYKRKLGKGQLEVLMGTTFQENEQTKFIETASNFSSDALIYNLQAATTISIGNYNSTDYRYSALYGRLGYNWEEKYLLNITARRDGSSRFGPGKQFGNFGAVGAGWVFSKEKLVEDNLSFLSFGKLRASYGTTGNDQITDYQYLSTYSAYSNPYQGQNGLYPTRITNPYYGWEEVKKLEFGLDLGFLKDRIMLNASYYRNRTDNQLVGYSLPTITGFSSITANLPALIQNTGLELELNTINIKGKNFSWTSSANISFPSNKLLAYPNLAASSYANTYTIGHSLFSKKGYHYTGVDPQTGLYTFEDVNHDGNISSPQDYITMPPRTQKFFGGFLNTITYKSFQLDVFIQFVDQTGYSPYSLFGLPGFFISGSMGNQPVWVLSRWQQPGNVTDIQRFSQNNTDVIYSYSDLTNSDFNVANASFVRLKNLSLSYNLPAKWQRQTHLQNARIYLQCQNLFTITGYKGLDPENNSGLLLPPLRMITAGVKFSL